MRQHGDWILPFAHSVLTSPVKTSPVCSPLVIQPGLVSSPIHQRAVSHSLFNVALYLSLSPWSKHTVMVLWTPSPAQGQWLQVTNLKTGLIYIFKFSMTQKSITKPNTVKTWNELYETIIIRENWIHYSAEWK